MNTQEPRRRYLLDDAKQREICALLSIGLPRRVAAEYVDCAVSTIRRHAQRDATFSRRLAQAEARLEMTQLRGIQEIAQEKKDWRAAAWLLERRYPERYAAPTARRAAARRARLVLDEVTQLLQACLPDDAQAEVAARLTKLARKWSRADADKEFP